MSCVLCVVGYVYIIYAITTGKMSFTHQETTCWSWLQFGFSIATFDFLAIRCTLDRKNKIAGTPRVRGIELKTLASQGEHPPYQQRGLSAGWAISPPTMATTTTMLPPFFSASSAEQPGFPPYAASPPILLHSSRRNVAGQRRTPATELVGARA